MMCDDMKNPRETTLRLTDRRKDIGCELVELRKIEKMMEV